MATRVSIVGVTGYTGQELLDILLKHPKVAVTGVYSTTEKPFILSESVPRFARRTDLVCQKLDIRGVIADSDVVFLALPHTQAMSVVPQLLKAKRQVIDLSADYRLKDPAVYAQAYGVKHTDVSHVSTAVYGLPELYRNKIKGACLLANPGCYPTCAILGLAPLLALGVADHTSIIIDAKSGTSGAGKKAAQELLFSEVCEDFRAYKVNVHQHIPEIVQELSKLAGKKPRVTFVPHLLPLKRGILETMYLKGLKSAQARESLIALYKKFYKKEPFVRIREKGFPGLKDVAGTNFCDIGVESFGRDIIVISAIDNLVKGASGQAVQNFNIMMGYPEAMGLV